MNSEKDKQQLMKNLPRLKDQEMFKGVSVAEDYTQAEREIIRKWRDEARNKTEQDPDFIWRVRGSPKKRMTLKKFPKQSPASNN